MLPVSLMQTQPKPILRRPQSVERTPVNLSLRTTLPHCARTVCHPHVRRAPAPPKQRERISPEGEPKPAQHPASLGISLNKRESKRLDFGVAFSESCLGRYRMCSFVSAGLCTSTALAGPSGSHATLRALCHTARVHSVQSLLEPAMAEKEPARPGPAGSGRQGRAEAARMRAMWQRRPRVRRADGEGPAALARLGRLGPAPQRTAPS